jgi:hypothetical protein
MTACETGVTKVTAVACNRSREILIFHYCSRSSSIIFYSKARGLILINLNRDGRMRSVQKQHGVFGTSQQVLEEFKDQDRPKLYLKIQFVARSNHTASRL